MFKKRSIQCCYRILKKSNEHPPVPKIVRMTDKPSCMIKHTSIALWLLLTPVLCAGEGYQYLGPVETLGNGTVTLQVALDVGRIVSFRQHNEPDWIVVFDEEPIPVPGTGIHGEVIACGRLHNISTFRYMVMAGPPPFF
ncbi:hypothetical protein [Cerasicoccus arenae]|uniref:hypothetical protein n=1 Tax=Cerasicoccus arenae TaxID=424488 RepID=UPI00167A2D59|nr:hypothetical protein [Cerasicoccus arenae]MBK1859277.1 hypothetical protein [Cerasicoccus arenae]